MANNCLVTKLKGTVDNPNLPYLGELRLKLISESASINDFAITSSSTIRWKSSTPLSGATEGEFTGTKAFTFSSDGEVTLAPMYGMTELYFHGANVTDLAKIVTNTGNLTLRNGGGYAEHGDIRTNIIITGTSSSYQQASVPLIFDGDYSKISFSSDITSIYTKYLYKVISEVGKSVDLSVLSNSPSKEKFTSALFTFSLAEADAIKNLAYISNIEAFSEFINVTTISLHSIPIKFGSVVTALSPMTKLAFFAIIGHNTQEDLAVLFNAWKSAGRHDDSCQFWFSASKYRITGYPSLSDGTYTVTFDANGNWTVA